jgi:phage terminase large subunit GpA-like protein
VTRWLIRCDRCGTESTLNVGFDLTNLGSKLYIYCEHCRRNTEHTVLGYYDDDTGEFTPFEKALSIKYKSL